MAAATPIILPALGKASKAAQASITEALTADLVVLKGTSRLSRRKHSTPLEWEFHLNPAALGVAAVGAGLTLWLMQLRVGTDKKTVKYGYWYQVGLNKSYPEVPYDKRGHAPVDTIPEEGYWTYKQVWIVDKDRYYVPGEGHYVRMPDGSLVYHEDIPGYWVEATGHYETRQDQWIITVPAHTETATWVETRVVNDIPIFATKERQGFLGNGVGSSVGDTVKYFGWDIWANLFE